MAHPRGKSETEHRAIAAMTAAAAAYDGPITHCPPGVARGHEAKIAYETPVRKGSSGLRPAKTTN